MTAVQDNAAIHSLLSQRKEGALFTYRTRSLESQLPTTLTFTDRIEFNTSALASRVVDYSQAFLQIPITVTLPVAMTPGQTYPAFKTSDLSILSGSALSHSDGRPIFTDYSKSAYFASALRLALEESTEWQASHGEEIGFSMDRNAPGVRGLDTAFSLSSPSVVRQTATGITGCPGITINDENPYFNIGYAEKQVYIRDRMFDDLGVAIPQAADLKSFNILVNLPLSKIHDFFKQLDMPMTGTELLWTFNLNTPSSTGHTPFCIGSSSDVTQSTVNKANVPDTGASASGGGLGVAITVNQVPRLFYHSVEMAPKEQARFNAMLSEGFTKKLEWSAYDLHTQSSFNNIDDTKTFNNSITTSACGVVRIFQMVYPAGIIDTTLWPSTLVTPYSSTNVDLMVGNESYYPRQINTVQQQWAMLKSAMGTDENNDTVGLITYSMFLKNHRILCLDLTRLAGRVADPNLPLSFLVSGTVVSEVGQKVDIVYIVERKMQGTLGFKFGMRTSSSSGPKQL